MINRQNWLDTKEYLHHAERIRQNTPSTVSRARKALRHLLEWADETELPRARLLDPTFPTYLLTARADGKSIPLSPASITKDLMLTRQFFSFARIAWPLRYKTITLPWIESLQPPRHVRLDSRLPVRELYTLEEVRQIAHVSIETLRQERGRVAACMLFLSGMRADALASLPVAAVDLGRRQLHQLPELGVRTKNSKAAITHLLNIPELLEVVQAWDQRVRQGLPHSALWYATLTSDGMGLTGASQAHQERYHVVGKDIALICQQAGIPYRSPHKFRHGHVVYALKQAHNMAELKAISQNIMHSSVVTTDQIYGRLVTDDVAEIIAHLGIQPAANGLEQKIEQLLQLLNAINQQGTLMIK